MRVRAPGKVNVYLAVGELQEDGYHELATAFQAVSLYEEVSATMAADISLTVTGDVPLGDVPLDGNNLALRAARLLAERTGVDAGVRLEVHKNVPVAGGMGGGSADAAATLVACDVLWETGLSTAELHVLAAELGADVPFSLHGGTAIGTGRGDELSPVLTKGRFDWVLVTSGAGLSTPAVYGELDRHRERHRANLPIVPVRPRVDAEIFHALRAGDPVRLAAAVHNDLQAAALGLRRDLAAIIDLGVAEGALVGLVSGSGPTVALLCADAESAREVQVSMSAAGHVALYAHGPVPGARVIG